MHVGDAWIGEDRAAGVAELAGRVNAEHVLLPDLGHFWMLEDPGLIAETLEAFWSRLGSLPQVSR